MQRSLSGLKRRVMRLTAHLEQEKTVCDEDLLAKLDEGRQRNARGESPKLTHEESKAISDRLWALRRAGLWP
jgi:hypothetical protein